MPKLKYDLVLARQDDLVYGLPRDEGAGAISDKTFTLLGIEAAERDRLTHYDTVEQGTAVSVKLTLDEGARVGARRLLIFVGETEVFTGEWALEP